MKIKYLKAAVAAAVLLNMSLNAAAQSYYFFKPLPGKSKGVVTAPGPVDPAISLASSALPDGGKGNAYSFDLRTLTTLQGGPGIEAATFSLASGTLPTGITLSNTGQLTGTPTAKTAPAGSTFTVQGSYVTANGQRAYTIVVNTVPLQVTQLSLGQWHACAITTAGAAVCWGANDVGQLGNGTPSTRSDPVTVSGLSAGVLSITAGRDYSCAVTAAGGAKCWGINFFGVLGDDTQVDSATPVDVIGLSTGVASISASAAHTCAVMTSGAVKCWGLNGSGELGDGTTTDSTTPVDVVGLPASVAHISLGGSHTCAVTTTGAAKCWGLDSNSQLGNPTYQDSATPVDVSGLSAGVAHLSAGNGHTCVVTTAGAAKCWGTNNYGQLGDGTKSNREAPVTVNGLSSGVARISAGATHTCAVTTSGAAMCWGNNGNGQLGDITQTTSTLPTNVSGLSTGVSRIIAGGDFTCAVTTDGQVKCWGANEYGQLSEDSVTEIMVPFTIHQ